MTLLNYANCYYVHANDPLETAPGSLPLTDPWAMWGPAACPSGLHYRCGGDPHEGLKLGSAHPWEKQEFTLGPTYGENHLQTSIGK